MNYELFIAKRIIAGKKYKNSISSPIIKIAITAIALGIIIMLIAVATGAGLQYKIRDKMAGFKGHVQIINYDANNSDVSTVPIKKDQEALVLNGQHYPRGTKFGLLYGSANRDPDQFPDADTFDITRNPNRHVAFGRGAHLCLGNHLSRLDMEVIFLTILRRTRHIELTGPEPAYKRSLSVRGPESLSVTLTPK